MFKPMINRLKAYYNTLILPKEMFEDTSALTPEEEEAFVSLILTDPKRRRLIEKHLTWRVGLNTKNAMRAADDDSTRKHKERTYGVGEITYDYKVMWERVYRRREAKVEQEKPTESGFKFFGSNEDTDE